MPGPAPGDREARNLLPRSIFFAIPNPFFFWKEVNTNPFNPDKEHLEAKRSHYHFRYVIGQRMKILARRYNLDLSGFDPGGCRQTGRGATGLKS
jgi:hypothetical protein